jgi:hypothetical protein
MRRGEEAAEGRELREGSGGQGRMTRQQRSGKGGLDGRLTSAQISPFTDSVLDELTSGHAQKSYT